jgi:hypothetical protein
VRDFTTHPSRPLPNYRVESYRGGGLKERDINEVQAASHICDGIDCECVVFALSAQYLRRINVALDDSNIRGG